jgi:Uma2 family endonuclease
MPKTKHSRLQSKLAAWIDQFAEPHRLAAVFTELRATFAGASVVPDVSVFAWQRLPRDEMGEFIDDVFEPPDIAIEIVSPGQRIAHLVERCGWYVDNGVRIALMVNARDSSVTKFCPDEPPIVLRGDTVIDVSEVIPGFQLTVKTLFDALILA